MSKMGIHDIRPATLRKVVKYLEEELGLSIYGTHVDVETATAYPGCMDCGIDDVLAIRKFYMQGGEFDEAD